MLRTGYASVSGQQQYLAIGSRWRQSVVPSDFVANLFISKLTISGCLLQGLSHASPSAEQQLQ